MAKRHWEFDFEDGSHHVVDLEHGFWLGRRKITIDGKTTVGRGTPFTDHSGQYTLTIAGHDARLRISTNGLTYFYDLVVDGRSVTDGKAVGAPPRPRPGGPGTERVFGAVLVILFLPMFAFVAKGSYDEYRYHTASATAAATVQDKRVTTGRNTSYVLSYTFVDRSGAARNGSDDVSRRTFDEARAGSRYLVQYLPDEPGVNRFSGRDDTLPIAGVAAFAVFGLSLGGYYLIRGSRRLAAMKRVGAVGQPVTATVTKLKTEHLQGVGKTVTVEYTYEDPFGRRRRGRGPLMFPDETARYTVGGPVRVLIDPDRPGDSVLP